MGEIAVVEIIGSRLPPAAGEGAEAVGLCVYAVGFQVHGGIGIGNAAGILAHEAAQKNGGIVLGRQGGQSPHSVGGADLPGVGTGQTSRVGAAVVGGVHMEIGGLGRRVLDQARVHATQAPDINSGGVDLGGKVHAVHGAVYNFAG